MPWSPFRRAFDRSARRRRARSLKRRGGASSGLARWETLGFGLGDALLATESLEARAMMAADLTIDIDDGSAWYSAGTEVTYRVGVVNIGNATATNALVSTSLATKLSSITWTAAYSSSGASGATSGSGNLANAKITLEAGKRVDFEIVGTVAADATGNLVSGATVTLGSETESDTDTDTRAPKSIVITHDAGWNSTPLVRVIDPVDDTVRASFQAYEDATLRGGLQAVVVDLDNDGRDEIVTAPGRGRVAEIRVFKSNDAGTAYTEDASYRTTPFGAGWKGGVSLAAGDFNGDGRVDLAAAKATGDGEIRIFHGQAGADPIADAFRTIRPFSANFLGGATLAAADLGTFSDGTTVNAGKQDGRAELIVGSGPTVAPVVRVYDTSAATPIVIDTIRPFSPALLGGVAVAAARVNTDGIPDIIISSGRRGNSATEIYDGKIGAATNARLKQYEAFAALGRTSSPGSAQAIDQDGDGKLDTIYSVQGAGGTGSLTKITLTNSGVTRSTVAGVSGPLNVAATGVRANPDLITTASGLRYVDLKVGTGAVAAASSSVRVTYAGTYLNAVQGRAILRSGSSTKTGTLVSRSAGEQFDSGTQTFPISGLIQGWIEGIPGMRVGGRRQLIVPANLGYGANGSGNFALGTTSIPPNADLVFDIELLEVT
jgi:peptidylprolyl isomerase